MNKKLHDCPFCGGSANIVVSDDEGNIRNYGYLNDPYSGVTYQIKHDNKSYPNCPIANHYEDGGIVGTILYESEEELISNWNFRF